MTRNTAMADALKRAGKDGQVEAAYLEVVEIVEQSKTLDSAAEVLEARTRGNPIKRLRTLRLLCEFVARDMGGTELSEGYLESAGKASSSVPSAQTHDGERASRAVLAKANESVPASPSPDASPKAMEDAPKGCNMGAKGDAQKDGKGYGDIAEKANRSVPFPVSPSYVEAMKANAGIVARSIFDSFKIRDGRAIGDLTFGEIERIRTTNVREAAVLRQVQKHCSYAEPGMKVREIVSREDMERFIQRAAEVADAA
jgi:hypothetical protein